MNRTMFVPVLLVLLLVAANPMSMSAAPQDEKHSSKGRYQLVAGNDGTVYVIDTTSGQCWSRTKDGKWVDAGNPVKGEVKSQRDAPPTLRLPKDSVQITVQQRQAKPIPGSRERILLHLGDITEGQALLSVKTDQGRILLDDRSVREGDVVEFQVEKKKYAIRVRQLRNLLLGDDFGVFEISSSQPAQEKPAGTDRKSAEKREEKHDR